MARVRRMLGLRLEIRIDMMRVMLVVGWMKDDGVGVYQWWLIMLLLRLGVVTLVELRIVLMVSIALGIWFVARSWPRMFI